MKKFTFIAEFKGGTYISQYSAACLSDALSLWADKLDLQYYKEKEKRMIIEKFKDKDFFPSPIEGIEHVWCGAISAYGNFLLLNIVETT